MQSRKVVVEVDQAFKYFREESTNHPETGERKIENQEHRQFVAVGNVGPVGAQIAPQVLPDEKMGRNNHRDSGLFDKKTLHDIVIVKEKGWEKGDFRNWGGHEPPSEIV